MFDFTKIYGNDCFVEDDFDPLGKINIKCPPSDELDELLVGKIDDMIEALLYDKDKVKLFNESNKEQLRGVIPYTEKMKLHKIILVANNVIESEDIKKK